MSGKRRGLILSRCGVEVQPPQEWSQPVEQAARLLSTPLDVVFRLG
jgi:hypothetical protein